MTGSRVQALLEVTFLLNLFCSNTILASLLYFRENSTLCETVTFETVEFSLMVLAEFNESSRNPREGGYQGYSMSGKDTIPNEIVNY